MAADFGQPAGELSWGKDVMGHEDVKVVAIYPLVVTPRTSPWGYQRVRQVAENGPQACDRHHGKVKAMPGKKGRVPIGW